MNGPKNKKYIIVAAVLVIVLFALTCKAESFFSLDNAITDRLYTQFEGVDPAIKIIAVDEDTLASFGQFTSWSREKTGDLLKILATDEYRPSVVGVDFIFAGQNQEDVDKALAEASADFDRIVFAGNIVYKGITVRNANGHQFFDEWNVDYYETPFEALKNQSSNGFANAYMSKDGFLRAIKPVEYINNEEIRSFAYEVYAQYRDWQGKDAVMPKTVMATGLTKFMFSGEVGEYPVFSMVDVLDGKIPGREFKDCIVLIGAYASGMQDAYAVAGDRGNPMNGVEVQANLVQAYMQQKTVLNVNSLIYILVASVVLLCYVILANRQKLVLALIEGVALTVLHLVTGRVMCQKLKLSMPQLYFVMAMVACMLYFVIEKYFIEKIRAKKTIATFKKFVAPQVVDELAAKGELALVPGGTKRDIAVLFVDIRGFTTMSEILKPEEVVEILNEYLSHTTKCVFDNRGTLDKFVGDCTMAVFNAPFDQEDYIFKAVKTAVDIQEGAKALSDKLLKKYGRTVDFGVGVNCGEAVVGNIGCENRMDYTAIGDTVNTSARLEANAGAGQILVSTEVYEAVKDRVTAEYIGELSLKGKAKAVPVYNIKGLLK